MLTCNKELQVIKNKTNFTTEHHWQSEHHCKPIKYY